LGFRHAKPMNSDWKILVIDHDPAERKAIRATLEMAGYSTAEAASAAGALRLAHRYSPALLLMNANPPAVDGIKTCQQIIADPRLAGTLVVLFSAAGADSRQRVRGLEAGAVEFLTLPIDEQELLARIQALLRIRIAVDATEHSQEQQQAQEQLIRQAKLAVVEQLAGGVGHELANPLSVIYNAVYYLKLIQPETQEKVKEYLGMIEKEIHTAEKIIADLLDFARIKNVDLKPVVAADLVQHALERHPAPESIAVVLEFPASLPKAVADPRQVEQVLGNLVINAYQAMPTGGNLTITAVPQKTTL